MTFARLQQFFNKACCTQTRTSVILKPLFLFCYSEFNVLTGFVVLTGSVKTLGERCYCMFESLKLTLPENTIIQKAW